MRKFSIIFILLVSSCNPLRYEQKQVDRLIEELPGKYYGKTFGFEELKTFYSLYLYPGGTFRLEIRMFGSDQSCKGQWTIMEYPIISCQCDGEKEISKLLSNDYMIQRIHEF